MANSADSGAIFPNEHLSRRVKSHEWLCLVLHKQTFVVVSIFRAQTDNFLFMFIHLFVEFKVLTSIEGKLNIEKEDEVDRVRL